MCLGSATSVLFSCSALILISCPGDTSFRAHPSSCHVQVTRLCRAHRLHSALAFLFNRALGDYTAPAAELLLAFVHAPDESPAESASESAGDSPTVSRPGLAAAWGARRATGYKLLVYLHCCLSGRAFPPGSPSVPADNIIPL